MIVPLFIQLWAAENTVLLSQTSMPEEISHEQYNKYWGITSNIHKGLDKLEKIHEGLYPSDRTIESIEQTWRGKLRWTNLDSLLQHLTYAFVLQNKDVKKNGDSFPTWLPGGSIPLESQNKRRYVLFVDGFRQGIEFLLVRFVHLSIATLAGYELFLSPQHHKCQSTSENFLLFMLHAGDDMESLSSAFHAALKGSNQFLHYASNLWFVPILGWGLTKGALNVRNGALEQQKYEWKKENTSLMSYCLDDLKRETSLYDGVTHSCCSEIWKNFIRWLLPLRPLDRKLNRLMKNMLWNKEIKDQDLEESYLFLKELTEKHLYYTSIVTLNHMMKIVYGSIPDDTQRFVSSRHETEMQDSAGNLRNLQISTDDSNNDEAHYDRQAIKKEAFKLLKTMASLEEIRNQKTLGKKFNAVFHALYSQYLLWSLGSPNAFFWDVAFPIFKLGKLYWQGKFAYNLFNTFYQVKKNLDQPDVSLNGIEPWVCSLPQTCFESLVHEFNVLPGQPVDTLTGSLDKYNFASCTIQPKLSGKALTEQQIDTILQDFATNKLGPFDPDFSFNTIQGSIYDIITLIQNSSRLNFSHNQIGLNGIPINFSWFAHIGNLQYLNFAYNQIGSQGSVVQFSGLPQPFFDHNDDASYVLDLSHNQIGSEGTMVSFKGLPTLSFANHGNARYLVDFSSNQIGSQGTNVSFAGLPSVSFANNGLSSYILNLSHNQIGSQGRPVNFGEFPSPSFLPQPDSCPYTYIFDLSHNMIGSNGTILNFTGFPRPIFYDTAKNPCLCSYLLNLSHNQLGSRGSSMNFSGLPNPFFPSSYVYSYSLDLSGNQIGSNGAVVNLTDLPKPFFPSSYLYSYFLDFSDNQSGANGTIVNFMGLPNPIFPSSYPVSSNINFGSYLLDLSGNQIGSNGAIVNFSGLPSPSFYISSSYYLNFSNNQIGSSGVMGNFAGLPSPSFFNANQISSIFSLDLSCNQIGSNDAVANFTGLPNPSCHDSSISYFLNLSHNQIGSNGTTYFTGLTPNFVFSCGLNSYSLDLSHNQIGSNGITVDFSNFPQVDFGWSGGPFLLDLSHNQIGSNGAVVNFSSFPVMASRMEGLYSIDFSHNKIGSNGTEVDFTNFPRPSNVGSQVYSFAYSVDLSHNQLGFNGSAVHFTGLAPWCCIDPYYSLDLSHNQIGSNGVKVNFTDLPNPTFYEGGGSYYLDLSNNQIGSSGVTVDFAGSPQFSLLDLSDNLIGSNGLPMNFSGFSHLKQLQQFNLARNQIGSNGAAVDFTGLSYLANLQILDLSGNQIGSGNVNWHGFDQLANLESLDLSNNNISTHDAEALFSKFSGLQYLATINLAGNQIGLNDPFDWTGLPPNLVSLDISNNKLGANGAEIDFSGLSGLQYPAIINLAGNSLGLSRSINWTGLPTSLTYLNVSDCFLSSKAKEDLLSVLPSLPSISFKDMNKQLKLSWKDASPEFLKSFQTSSMQQQCQAKDCFSASSGGSSPSSFWKEATKGLATIYQTVWEMVEHPRVQTIGWSVAASNMVYGAFQTWPLLATYVAIGGV
jgi:hypothetical protein